jgi:ribonuclease P protein component
MALYLRLKKNKEYKKVYRYGKSVADHLVVLFAHRHNNEASRFGFTVSKKVGNAVVRNRVRRLFKEICRKHAEEFPAYHDYIILARNNIVGKNYQAVENSIIKLLRKLFYRKVGRDENHNSSTD